MLNPKTLVVMWMMPLLCVLVCERCTAASHLTNVIVEMRLGSNDLALIEQKCGCDTNIMQEIDVAKKGKANEDRGFDRETFLKAEEADLVRALGELRFERF